MVGQALSRAMRLRRAAEFRALTTYGAVWAGAQVLVRRLPNELGHPRLGVGAPRRFGTAPVRNRFRRLAREALRLEQAELGSYDYLITPRKGLLRPTLCAMRADLRSTGRQAPLPPRRSPSS